MHVRCWNYHSLFELLTHVSDGVKTVINSLMIPECLINQAELNNSEKMEIWSRNRTRTYFLFHQNNEIASIRKVEMQALKTLLKIFCQLSFLIMVLVVVIPSVSLSYLHIYPWFIDITSYLHFQHASSNLPGWTKVIVLCLKNNCPRYLNFKFQLNFLKQLMFTAINYTVQTKIRLAIFSHVFFHLPNRTHFHLVKFHVRYMKK